MTDKKISELTALTGAQVAADDVVAIVDTSVTETKKIRADQLSLAVSTSLGLGTMATQNANNVAITGGSVNGTSIGGTTRAAGNFTTLDANGNVTLGDATSDTITATGRFNTDLVPSTDNARDLGTTALKWRQVYSTNFTENGFPVTSQTDIGTAPNQVPLNQYLGNVAFMDSNQLVVNPAASVSPAGIGDMVFQLTSNTSLEIKVRGSDGTVRSVALTLA
jgi:hypothetical protein